MKYFFTVIWVLACLGVLAYSHVHWNQQTAVQAVKSEQEELVIEKEVKTDVINTGKYMKLAANWPEAAKDQLNLALKEERPFKILFVGSPTSEWENTVTQNLTESYGSERIITAKHFYDLTSDDFLTENMHTKLAAEKAQMVVIEPFLLNDNGSITIDVTLANLTEIIAAIKADNPDTTFILQPSYPIYLPKYYSAQIEALKEYAEENQLPYLDHWTTWPATDNPEIIDYLNEDQSGPNEKGYQAWAQFLVEYFVNK